MLQSFIIPYICDLQSMNAPVLVDILLSRSSANPPTLATVVPLTDKVVAKKMSSSYTVPLIDQPALDKDGKATRKFYFRPGGSVLTAQYILVLLQHFNDIVPLPTDIAAAVKRDNKLSMPGHLYAIPSAVLNNNMSEDVSGTRGNSRSGNAGNIAVAYFTPHREQMVNECIAARNLPLKGDLKLLSADQYALLVNMEAHLVLGRESENLGINLKRLSRQDLEFTISHYKEKGYTPVRIVFDHLPANLANIFNTKPINAFVKSEFQNEIEKYFHQKKKIARKIGSAELRKKYGIEIKNCVKNNISNNKFWCLFDHEGSLTEVKLVQSRELYYGRSNFVTKTVGFDANSFVHKSAEPLSGGLTALSRDVHGRSTTVEITALDIRDVLERTNYHGFREACLEDARSGALDVFTYALDKNAAKIANLLSRTKIESDNHGDNDDDLSIIALLKKLAWAKNAPFHLVKTQTESRVEDSAVYFLSAQQLGAKVTSYSRNGGKAKSLDNACSVVPYVSLHKCNLSFEREKAMTVLFSVTAIDWLKKEGHSDIELVFEIPVNKKDGDRGYLDCVVYSKLGGVQYGQAFEFKAWYAYSPDNQVLIADQCANYEIRRMMEAHGVVRTYSDESVNVVKGMNLLPSGALTLDGEASVPWLPSGAWGWTFEKPSDKKTLREITELGIIEDVDVDDDSAPAATAPIPDLVAEAKQMALQFVVEGEKPSVDDINDMLGFG
jgi:hypothetical protein